MGSDVVPSASLLPLLEVTTFALDRGIDTFHQRVHLSARLPSAIDARDKGLPGRDTTSALASSIDRPTKQLVPSMGTILLTGRANAT
jgi:hypothetical protein